MEDLPPDTPPVISTTKQTRILIWRDEVATASISQQASAHQQHQRSSDAASSSAATSSTSTSATSGGFSSPSRPAKLLFSRSRHLLRRIARRLSPNHEAYKFMRDDLDEGPPQTAMYSRVPPPPPPRLLPRETNYTNNNDDDDEYEDEDDAEAQLERQLKEIEDEDEQQHQPNTSPMLRDKQERLMRAARLLDQGVTMTV